MEEFKVKANPDKNLLHIMLGGFVMNSDIELVFFIAKKEVKLLKKGFEVKIDVSNFKTKERKSQLLNRQTKDLFKKMGAGKINYVQHSDFTMKNPVFAGDTDYRVGLYAYENAWFL